MSSAFPGPDATPAERVGPYHLLTELEQGALGPLWAARATTGTEEGRLVVVRRLSTVVCAPRQTQRVIEAAEIARTLRHSKLAAVLDVVVTEHEIAIVGEHVEGPTLGMLQRLAYAKRSPVPPGVALRIGVDLLHALRAARDGWQKHAPKSWHGASHGGLSPDSVFIAGFGEVFLGEIGVSAVASALEAFRTLPGIAAYRAPEQLRAGPTPAINERADVFSVGVVLWELLANRPLFGDPERLRSPAANGEASATERTLQDLQSKLIPPLGTTERDGAPISRGAADVVERALRRDPATRYATIDQMLGALIALGRDVVASSDQVAIAVDRLARAEYGAQRAALGPTSGSRFPSGPSAAPDSGRPTRRPDPASSSGPAAFEQQSAPVEQFSQHEAPTFPTAQLARSLKPPPPPRRKPADAPSSIPPAFGESLPPLPDLPEAAVAAPLSLPPPPQSLPPPDPSRTSSVAVEPARHSTAPSRQLRARRIALVIGCAVGLVGLLAVVRAMLSDSKTNGSEPTAAPAQSATLPTPHAPERAGTTAAPAPSAAEAVPEARPEPQAPPKTAAPEAPSRAEPARTVPPRGEENRPEPRPEPPKKSFRPKGI